MRYPPIVLVLFSQPADAAPGLFFDRPAMVAVERSAAVDPDGAVEIALPAGKISITGTDRPELTVRGKVAVAPDRLVLEGGGKHTALRLVAPEGEPAYAELEISVPARSRLKLKSASADLDVRGVTKDLSVETASGDVLAAGIGGEVELRTASGEVSLTGGDRVEISTVSGNIRAAPSGGRLSLSSVSGDIELVADQVEVLKAKSVSGDLEIAIGALGSGPVELKSQSGNVELALPKSSPARIRANTVSGEVEIPASLRSAEGPLVELASTSGDLLVRVR